MKNPNNEIGTSAPVVHARGASHYGRRATFGLRLGASIIDGALGIAVFFALHRVLRLSAVPEPWWLAAVILLVGASVAGGRAAFGRSAGDAAWRLKASGLLEPLLCPEKLEVGETFFAVFLTAASVVACAWSVDQAVFRQPVWAQAENLELTAYLPNMASGGWEALPFFYSLGAWPRMYRDKPVFYSLPYEKGPPRQFVGHVSARWDSPGAVVTFEGPKTPRAPVSATPAERTPRERIHDCLLGTSHSWSCLKIREATLLRHLEDMQQRLTGSSGGDSALSLSWRVRWFRVRNPALALQDEAQGIYLSAKTKSGLSEERYVLITENGTHQAIWLDYSGTDAEAAGVARLTFEQAIRSLRVSDQLEPGRAWIDRQMESLRLGREIDEGLSHPSTDPAVVASLAEAQARLVSKITVQPEVLEAYYQLGRTALVLDRAARAGPNVGHLPAIELAAVARPLIQSAYRYAQDIAPGAPKTTQLQGFWLESQKP